MSNKIAVEIIKWANIGEWVGYYPHPDIPTLQPFKITNITVDNGNVLYWNYEKSFTHKDMMDHIYPIEFVEPNLEECKFYMGQVAVWESSNKKQCQCEVLTTLHWDERDEFVYINNKALCNWLNSNYLINGIPFGTPKVIKGLKELNKYCTIFIEDTSSQR
jgi:hypothetical protein